MKMAIIPLLTSPFAVSTSWYEEVETEDVRSHWQPPDNEGTTTSPGSLHRSGYHVGSTWRWLWINTDQHRQGEIMSSCLCSVYVVVFSPSESRKLNKSSLCYKLYTKTTDAHIIRISKYIEHFRVLSDRKLVSTYSTYTHQFFRSIGFL